MATERVALKDEEGLLREETTLMDGLMDGETVIYQRGRVQARIQYSQGKRNGEALFYDNLGQVMTKVMYQDDKLHGEASYFDASGKLVRKSMYENDELSGRTIDYWVATGKAREISGYKANLLDGELVRFTEDGKLQERLCYKDGKQRPCPPLKRA